MIILSLINLNEKKGKILSVEWHIMQGSDWNNEDPTGWIMSEKLDGIRAYWDGKQFWSKRGIRIKYKK